MQVEQPSEGQTTFQVAWYFAPEGAKLYTQEQSFSAGIWDHDQIAQPPLLGEQPPYARPYYSGENIWGYTGQCVVGSPEQFRDGLSAADLAAPLPPIPSCCATPRVSQTWFLRGELKPPQKILPGAFVATWDNQGEAVSPRLLSSEPGPRLRFEQFSFLGPFSGVDSLGQMQYLTPPLPAQTIPSVAWMTAFGDAIFDVLRLQMRTLIAVSLIDGTTGMLKQVVQEPIVVGALVMTGQPLVGKGFPHIFPAIEIAHGDYICLELGFLKFASVPTNPHSYTINWYDGGSIPIQTGTALNSSPMSLLQWPVNGGEQDMMAPGTILPFAGTILPPGYLPCDGSAQSSAAYSALFAVIGTAWGTAGPGTFLLPDFRDRTLIGTSPGSLLDRPTARPLAQVGGEESHQLTVNELANHSHLTITGDDFATAVGLSAVNAPGFSAGSDSGNNATDSSGSDVPHNNMQPFAVVQWIIKV